jgi:hypothetical protein
LITYSGLLDNLEFVSSFAFEEKLSCHFLIFVFIESLIWVLIEAIDFLGFLVFSLPCPWSGSRKKEIEVIHSFE